MELTPRKIYEDFIKNNIDRNYSAELLISLVDNTDQNDIRLESIKHLKKIGLINEKIFHFLENLFISDTNGTIRCAAAQYIKEFFVDKSLSLIKWAIQYESDYDCMIIMIQILVELKNNESKSVLIDMIKEIKKTKYLDENKRIENKKFKKIAKKLLKGKKDEILTHQELAEIIVNYLTISELTKKFYSVYFELKDSLVINLDLSDVEYEVRGWKSDFKNNINEISEITGLENLKHLTHLNLSNNQIRNIKDLINIKNITHLFLYNNKINEIENLEYFKRMTNLKYLDIAGNQIVNYLTPQDFENIEVNLKKPYF
jgi:hypothetical protein